jgi:outer membrane protein assembly factor BamB
MRNLKLLLVLAVLSLAASRLHAADASENWPRWRGPQDSGAKLTGSFPTKFDHSSGYLWKTELPGIGCSTPIVWNRSIILTSVADGQDVAVAYDWAGQETWRTTIGKQRSGKHRNGSGSNPSAVTDGKHIFVYFKSGNLAGLDMTGKLLWKTNLQDRYGKDTLYWDLGTSPVVTEKDVVIAVMHKGDSYVAAFEKASGELSWKIDRNYKTPVEGDHSYATPIVIEHNGQQALLIWGAEHLTAHAASDGKELWSCAGFNPDEKRNWVAVASFVVSGDVAVVPYGRGSHLVGVKLGGNGDVTKSHRLWTRNDTGSFVPSPCTANGNIYVLKDRGGIECVSALSGETQWRGELPKHRSKYYASPTIAGDHIYSPREDGVLVVANIKGKFKVVSENDMGERLIASPVPVGNRLLIRGEKHLFCIGK